MRRMAVFAAAVSLAAVTASAQLKSQAPPQPAAPAVQTVAVPAPEPPLESARRIPRDEAIKLVREHKAIFVDVRAKESYDSGHIKGSINYPLFDIVGHIKDFPKGKLIITYCA